MAGLTRSSKRPPEFDGPFAALAEGFEEQGSPSRAPTGGPGTNQGLPGNFEERLRARIDSFLDTGSFD